MKRRAKPIDRERQKKKKGERERGGRRRSREDKIVRE